MTHNPPRWLERFGELLIPPASREHVLGDVAESSDSNFQYLINLARVLPSVVWGAIRRRANLGGVIFNGLISGFILGFCQAYFDSAGFRGIGAWLRLAVPWGVWVIGCVLAAAYGPSDKPASWNSKLFYATIAVAIGVGAVVGLSVAGILVGLGVVIGVTLILTMPWVHQSSLQQPLTVENLPQQACTFQKAIWWRNARESAVALVLILVQARDAWSSEHWSEAAGNLLLIAGMSFVLYYLQFRAAPRRVPEGDIHVLQQFHRREVLRQRDILRAIPWWYLLPLIPGMLVDLAQRGETSAPAIVGLAGVLLLVWRLNVWAANWLDRQLRDIDALGETIR